jgi:hypothetical protein
MLKIFLSSSTGDLLQVFERFNLALTQQQNNIEVQCNSAELRRLSNLPEESIKVCSDQELQ